MSERIIEIKKCLHLETAFILSQEIKCKLKTFVFFLLTASILIFQTYIKMII